MDSHLAGCAWGPARKHLLSPRHRGSQDSLALQPFTTPKAPLWSGLHSISVSPLHTCVSYNDRRHTAAISEWQHRVRNLGPKPYLRLKSWPYERLKVLPRTPPSPRCVTARSLLPRRFTLSGSQGRGPDGGPDCGGRNAPGSLERMVRISLVVAAKWPAGSLGEGAALWASPPPQACV